MNPWKRAKTQFRKAARHINLEPLLVATLLNPDRVVETYLPIKMDIGPKLDVPAPDVNTNPIFTFDLLNDKI